MSINNSNYLIEDNSRFSVISEYDYEQEQNKSRWIKDYLHGFIEFDQNIWGIIDTPQFQRMRNIKQLGNSHYVFPGATHTRFEHSLGTGHLSNQLMDYLLKNHDNKYEQLGFQNQDEFQRYKYILQISALCHDLGHGPYSHMFDNELLPRLDVHDWKHEDGSNMLLESLFEENEIIAEFKDHNFEKSDIELMKNLIHGEKSDNHPQWIYEVVSNKKNSIDVDKFDYMRRDAYNVGVTGFDFDQDVFMRETRIIDDTLAYHHKHSYNIYDLFGNRYKLYKQIYQHRVTQGIDLMICDALYEANHIFKFNEVIHDPKKYLRLNDHIISQIQNTQNLQKSNEIIDKISNRQLYRYVTEQLVNAQQKVDKKQILDFLEDGYKVDRNLINIVICKTSYCMKDNNPVDSVDFYKYKGQKIKIKAEDVSLMLPKQFQEMHVRIFIKQHENENNIMNRIKKGFRDYCKMEQWTQNTEGQQEKLGGKSSKRKQDRKIEFNFTPQKKIQLNPNITQTQ